MENYLNNWLEWQAMFGNCRPRTIEYYRQKIECFMRYSGCSDISVFDDLDTFEAIYSRFYGAEIARNTKSKVLATLQQFGDYLAKKKIIRENIARIIETPKIENIPIVPVTVGEIRDIYKVLDNRWEGELRERNRLIFDTFLYTGIRHNELISLKPEDIFHDRIVIREGKGGKYRVVGIPESLGESIIKWIKVCNSEYVFPGRTGGKATVRMVSALFTNLRKKSGIHIYPHLLRHTYATNCIMNGMNIYTLQQQLGHCNIKITARYLNIVPDRRVAEVQEFVKYDRNA